MEPRISVITLGVQNIEASRNFYEKGLGWKASSSSNDNFVVFGLNNIAFALFPEKALAEDAAVPFARGGFRGVAFAYNVASKDEVTKVLDQAKKAGATIQKEAQDVFWGGFSGYFADPDGHLFEVAYNPFWPLVDGVLQIPD